MTPDETRIIEGLSGCSFLPGSSQKRFIRQIFARDRAKPLTERQAAWLWAIAWSWRRQLPASLVDLARIYSGGIGIRGGQINAFILAAKSGTDHCAGAGGNLRPAGVGGSRGAAGRISVRST
jgi:hypothetical protein